MPINMTTATSVRPGKLAELPLLPTSETVLYAPSGFGAQVSTVLSNVSAADCHVYLSVVKGGGTAGPANRVLHKVKLTAEDTGPTSRLDLREFILDDGDFVSGKAEFANSVAVVMTGFEYGGSGITASGIQDDSMGDPGYATGATTVDGKCDVGVGTNRLLAALLLATHQSGSAGFASYDTLGMSCGNGTTSMGPPKVSVNFNQGGNLNGSAHIFAAAGPAANTRHTVRGMASKAGISMDLIVIPISLTGVLSVTGFVSAGPNTANAVNLPITTAPGHRVLLGGGFDVPPQGLKAVDSASVNRGRLRGFEGSPAIGFAVPHWGALMDALGVAGQLTLITRNALLHCVLGLDCVPA